MTWHGVLKLQVTLFVCLGSGVALAEPMLDAAVRDFAIVDDDDRLPAVLVDGLPVDTYVYRPTPRDKVISVDVGSARQTFVFPWGMTMDFTIRYRGRLYRQRLAPVEPHTWSGPDQFELPFRLNDNHGIVVKGSINGSPPLDLIFDTGASVSVLNQSSDAQGAKLTGGLADIALGPVAIRQTPMVGIAYGGALGADGVLGYNLFLGRRVIIDHARSVLRIEPGGGAIPPGYRTLPLRWRGARGFVDLRVDDGRGWRTVPMLLDTGSRWSLSLQRTDPLARDDGVLERLGERRGRKADGSRVHATVYTLPRVSLAGFELANVQADVEQPDSQGALDSAILGHDFLKRFDMIVDYRTSQVHVRPNGLVAVPYNPVRPGIGVMTASGLGLAGLLVVVFWLIRRRRGRS